MRLKLDFFTQIFQRLAIADCIYRSRFTSRWIFTVALDEYLKPKHSNSVPSLLQTHRLAAWITFGATVFGCHVCNDKGEEWFGVERLTFKWPGLYCHEKEGEAVKDRDFCLGKAGNRRYFLNPRKVRIDFSLL